MTTSVALPNTASQPSNVCGDVVCLNCGRTLGAAVQRLSDHAIAIRPRRGATPAARPVLAQSANGGLLCGLCGGRAFLEFDARIPCGG